MLSSTLSQEETPLYLDINTSVQGHHWGAALACGFELRTRQDGDHFFKAQRGKRHPVPGSKTGDQIAKRSGGSLVHVYGHQRFDGLPEDCHIKVRFPHK